MSKSCLSDHDLYQFARAEYQVLQAQREGYSMSMWDFIENCNEYDEMQDRFGRLSKADQEDFETKLKVFTEKRGNIWSDLDDLKSEEFEEERKRIIDAIRDCIVGEFREFLDTTID